MINFDDVIKGNKKNHKNFWPSNKILIFGDTGSGKTNSLFNLSPARD